MAAVTTGLVRDVFKASNVAILYSTTPGATQLARRQKELLERTGAGVSGRVKFDDPGDPRLPAR